jgi:uncharacterized metal-binding protein
MVDLPKKKVGIVACSGEELPEGTITRLAALHVLEQLRPDETVTICLPLFLAGGEGDRAFAKFYPTIAVDGCELRCAARATAKYSNEPAANILVQDVIAGSNLSQPSGRHNLDKAGIQAVEITAQKIAGTVDELLGTHWSRKQGKALRDDGSDEDQGKEVSESGYATCACGSGIPIQKVMIAGKETAIVGLPLLLQQFVTAGKSPAEANMSELLEMVKIYNPIPDEEVPAYREGLRMAYLEFWDKGKST